MTDSDKCLDVETVIQYVDGLLDTERHGAADRHLSDCFECRQMVAELARDIDATIGDNAERRYPLSRGDKVGRYTVIALRGRGGMGLVYEAHDPKLDRQVAIKLVGLGGTPIDVDRDDTRLLREARALARLSHPNVVTVFEVGTEDDWIYIAMEYLDGGTLADWLKVSRPAEEVTQALLGVGRGLAAAHDAGLVHRDVKPGNIIVDDSGKAVLVDFGLVTAEHHSEPETPTDDAMALSRLTMTGAFVGTPAYMAPEQHFGDAVDARSDQWAFSACLYEALVGHRPFVGKSVAELKQRIATTVVPAIPGQVPRRVRRAVIRGLSRNPKDRFASMRDMVRALEGRPNNATFVALLAAVIAGLAVAALFTIWREEEVCTGGAARAAAVWNEARATEVAAQFEATKIPSGRAIADRVSDGLNRYVSRWVELHQETCRETRVRKERSPEAMALSMACFDRRLRETHALVSLLRRAETDIVPNAENAVDDLGTIDQCLNYTRLSAIQTVPNDPQLARRVSNIRNTLAETKALVDLGRAHDALKTTTEVQREASDVTFQPLQAEIAFARGRALDAAGEYENAEKTLSDAAYVALKVADDALFVRSAALLVRLVGVARADRERGVHWHRAATAVLERMGGELELSIELDSAYERYLVEWGDYKSAQTISNKVIQTLVANYGDHDPRIAAMYQRMAYQCANLHDYACAEMNARRAYEAKVAHYGPEHPAVGRAMSALGFVAAKTGRYAEAVSHHRKAVRLLESSLGREHPLLAHAYQALCWPLADTGKIDEALTACKRALEITRAHVDADSPQMARMLGTTGYIHYLKKEYDESYRLRQRAQAITIAAYGHEHVWVSDYHQSLGQVRQAQQRYAEAAEHFAQSLKIRRKALPPGNPRTLQVAVALGEAYRRVKDLKRALVVLEEAAREVEKIASQNPGLAGNCRFNLSRALWAVGRRQRARSLARRAQDDYARANQTELADEVRAWLRGRPK